jgi:hypothetical protein
LHLLLELKYWFESTYYHYYLKKQGKKAKPIFFLPKESSKPYHIDYCFGSTNNLKKLVAMKTEVFVKRNHYSALVPLILNFDI